jgi:hypothetical protein
LHDTILYFLCFSLRVRLRIRNLTGEPGANQVPWLIFPQPGAAFGGWEDKALKGSVGIRGAEIAPHNYSYEAFLNNSLTFPFPVLGCCLSPAWKELSEYRCLSPGGKPVLPGVAIEKSFMNRVGQSPLRWERLAAYCSAGLGNKAM